MTKLHRQFNVLVFREEDQQRGQSSGTSSQDTISQILRTDLGEEWNIQDLMLQAYRAVGDPDGVYGCGAGKLVDRQARYCSSFF